MRGGRPTALRVRVHVATAGRSCGGIGAGVLVGASAPLQVRNVVQGGSACASAQAHLLAQLNRLMVMHAAWRVELRPGVASRAEGAWRRALVGMRAQPSLLAALLPGQVSVGRTGKQAKQCVRSRFF